MNSSPTIQTLRTPFEKAVKSSLQSSPNRIITPDYRFFCQSSEKMNQCSDESIALTVTSPPYWDAIDYDKYSTNRNGQQEWYREREYTQFGDSLDSYLSKIESVFSEVWRVTVKGGFCAIVVGTLLQNGHHHPLPMLITSRMLNLGWEFHQDIIWNKVTGGVKRAGSYIQHKKSGYYYPNIMTEYILIFRRPGDKRRGTSESHPIDTVFKYDVANNVWHVAPVPPKTIDHPCPYPLEIVRRLVLLYSDEGETVLDPFLGSGQTAIGAASLNRVCVGYDVEQKYIDLSVERIKNPPSKRPFNLIARFEKIPAI